jgi:hypothetical protein
VTQSKLTKQTSKQVWLPAKDLYIKWAGAQRQPSDQHIKELADDLDLDLIDVIHVTLPVPTKHHVCDGWHRICALRMRGFENDNVPCIIHPIADAQSAARLFYKLNTGRKPPTAVDKYITGVTSGYTDHVAVDTIVRAAGYTVKNETAEDVIRAAGALMLTYKRFGEQTLRATLETIRDTWGKDENSMVAGIINGYGVFLHQHDSCLDYARLIDRMAKNFTPGRLVGSARSRREIMRGSEANAVAQILEDTYNTGLRAGTGKRLVNGGVEQRTTQ